jgi:hypothetical protein
MNLTPGRDTIQFVWPGRFPFTDISVQVIPVRAANLEVDQFILAKVGAGEGGLQIVGGKRHSSATRSFIQRDG